MKRYRILNNVKLVDLLLSIPTTEASPAREHFFPFLDQGLLEEQQKDPDTCRTDQTLCNHHKRKVRYVAFCVLIAALFLGTVHENAQLPGRHPAHVRLASLN